MGINSSHEARLQLEINEVKEDLYFTKKLMKLKILDMKAPLVVVKGPLDHETARKLARTIKDINEDGFLFVLGEDMNIETLDDEQLKRMGLERIKLND